MSVYLAEMATVGHKGFYTAWQSASQQISSAVAATLGFELNEHMPASTLADWGWRVPFFVGCAIIPVIFVLRSSLCETDAYQERKHHPTTRAVAYSMRRNWRVVIAGMLLVAMTTTTFYLITVNTPTFGKTVLHLSARDSLLVTLLVAISNFCWLPVGGALSDRIGRRPLLVAMTALAIVTVYPTMSWLTAAPSFGRIAVFWQPVDRQFPRQPRRDATVCPSWRSADLPDQPSDPKGRSESSQQPLAGRLLPQPGNPD